MRRSRKFGWEAETTVVGLGGTQAALRSKCVQGRVGEPRLPFAYRVVSREALSSYKDGWSRRGRPAKHATGECKERM